MNAVRLHAPRDLRVGTAPSLAPPGPGQARIRVGSVGVCGSDLHMYETGRIGDAIIKTPLVLGHEFGGVVVEASAGAIDGLGAPLIAGTRVAVDPAVPCRHCRQCEEGHPNLCPHHTSTACGPMTARCATRCSSKGAIASPCPRR